MKILTVGKNQNQLQAKNLSWNRVLNEIPTISIYDLVIVVPEAKSQSIQEELLNLILDDIRLFREYTGRIIWILNEHTITSLGGKLGIGELLSIRKVDYGEISCYIQDINYKLEDIYFGFKDVPISCLSVAHWKGSNSVKVAIAASTKNDNWFLSPITDLKILTDKVGPSARQKFSSFSILGSLLLFILIISSTWLLNYKSERSKLVSQYSTHNSILDLPLAYPENKLNTVWLNPEKRMAARLLSKERDYYVEMSEFMVPRENPYNFWERYNEGEVDVYGDDTMFYKYALLSGNFPMAYKIAKESILGEYYYEPYEWSRALTETLWQLTIESLHELDLEKTEVYNDIYLKLMSFIAAKAESDEDLLPQRILTLSRILQNELKSHRRNSFYIKPGIQNSFGRFNNSSWEYPLPEDDPYDLAERRLLHMPKEISFSKDSQHYVIYDSLKTLENIKRFPKNYLKKDMHKLEIYRYAPIECEYLVLKNEMLHYPTSKTIGKVLTFAEKDTYLADDIVNVLFTQIITAQEYLENEENIEKLPQLERFISAFRHSIPKVRLSRRLYQFKQTTHDSKFIIEEKIPLVGYEWYDTVKESIQLDVGKAREELLGTWKGVWGEQSSIIIKFYKTGELDFSFITKKVEKKYEGLYELLDDSPYFNLSLRLRDTENKEVVFPGLISFSSKNSFLAAMNFSADSIDDIPESLEENIIEFNKL